MSGMSKLVRRSNIKISEIGMLGFGDMRSAQEEKSPERHTVILVSGFMQGSHNFSQRVRSQAAVTMLRPFRARLNIQF
jgi:hypothetical protein